jgi:hypothetical protein
MVMEQSRYQGWTVAKNSAGRWVVLNETGHKGFSMSWNRKALAEEYLAENRRLEAATRRAQ